MKKLFLVLCMVCMFGLVGCGSKDNSKEDDKSAKSSDVSAAKSIQVSVYTAMGSEKLFEELTSNPSVKEGILFTEEGLNCLSSECKNELVKSVGNIPKVKYTKNGASAFAFTVDETGNVKCYIGTKDEPLKWQVSPEVDAMYQ